MKTSSLLKSRSRTGQSAATVENVGTSQTDADEVLGKSL